MTRLHKNLALNKKEWSKLLIKVKKLLNSELNHIRLFSDARACNQRVSPTLQDEFEEFLQM